MVEIVCKTALSCPMELNYATDKQGFISKEEQRLLLNFTVFCANFFISLDGSPQSFPPA